VDPPAASGKPLAGQQVTNQSPHQVEERPETARLPIDDDESLWRAAALDFGRTSFFRRAGEPLHFTEAEEDLAREWETQQENRAQRVAWKQAREVARDAWDQARSELLSGDAKPSAR
jgi:hypothetical protein